MPENYKFLREIQADLTTCGDQSAAILAIRDKIDGFLLIESRAQRSKTKGLGSRDKTRTFWEDQRSKLIFCVCDAGNEDNFIVITGLEETCEYLDMRESTFRARLSGGHGKFTYRGKTVWKAQN